MKSLGRVRLFATPWTVAYQAPPSMGFSRQEHFIDRGKGLRAETAQSALTVIFILVVSGLTSIILIVLGTVNLQFLGGFVSLSLRPFSELWPLMWWVKWVHSGHRVINFSTWGFSIYKTAHRI